MSRLIEDKYKEYKEECNTRFEQLQKNEEELNRIFIDIYGLGDELTPEVADRDVTVYRVFDDKKDVPETMGSSKYVLTKQDVIKDFISYAVGCMLGRYSLDTDGLAYAGGDFSGKWLEVSGQLYRREVIAHYVNKEISRINGVAEKYDSCYRDLQTTETSPERGNVCPYGSNEKGGSIDTLEYCGGTREKLYEGIRSLSIDSERLKSGVGNTTYDLCSPEILNAISSGNGSELVSRGWKDADRIDWKTIHLTLTTNHYSPDSDNCIPICDDEYFEDDIVGKFVKFVDTVYGSETLEENLKFIADALGGKGTPRQVIRDYFVKDFYNDHVKKYQKRPIYWEFSSGKNNGFKALVYMHRYKPDLLARMRTDYVHEQQERYRTQISLLETSIESATTSEKVKLNKQLAKFKDQSLEILKYEEKIHHLADQMIPIDLDDGVKVNYEKFKDVLEKIK